MNIQKKVTQMLRVASVTKQDVYVAAILIAASFLLPHFLLPSIEPLIGAATAIFAIVAGFFIADATENYMSLQSLISEENAILIAIAHELKRVEKTEADAVRKAIDEYMIDQLNVDGLDHIVFTKEEFERLLSALDEVINDDTIPSENVQEQRNRLIQLNQEMLLAAQSNLTAIHWAILITLGGVVSITMLAVRDGSLIMNIICAGMLLGCQGVLLVLRDVDNNRYLQRKLSFKNPQYVFQAICRPPYYPPAALPKQMIPNAEGEYRTLDTKTGLVVTLKK